MVLSSEGAAPLSMLRLQISRGHGLANCLLQKQKLQDLNPPRLSAKFRTSASFARALKASKPRQRPEKKNEETCAGSTAEECRLSEIPAGQSPSPGMPLRECRHFGADAERQQQASRSSLQGEEVASWERRWPAEKAAHCEETHLHVPDLILVVKRCASERFVSPSGEEKKRRRGVSSPGPEGDLNQL
eukprot:1155675-Pelagomonas_calceolata.AAC.1